MTERQIYNFFADLGEKVIGFPSLNIGRKIFSVERRHKTMLTESEVKRRLANMDFTLGSIITEENNGEYVSIPYPRWSCLGIFDDDKFREALQKRFLEHYSAYLSDVNIYSISVTGYYFLLEINSQLRNLGVNLLPLDYIKSYSDLEINNLALFDINLNTGKAMSEHHRFFSRIGNRPVANWVILFNDLIPPIALSKQATFSQPQLKYIYLGSEIIQAWENEETTSALLKLKKEWEGTRNWHDASIQGALHLLNNLQQQIEYELLNNRKTTDN